MWQQALGLQNQEVDVETAVNQNGFENIVRFGPAGSLGLSASQETAGGFGGGQTTPTPSGGFGGSQNGSQGRTERERGFGWQTHPVDAERMSRSKALEVAFGYAAANGLSPDEAFNLAKKIWETTNEGAIIEDIKHTFDAKDITDQVNEEAGREVVQTGQEWQN
jgi:hypothetical protein